MRWTEVPAGDLHAAEQRLRVALGDNAGVVINLINTNPVFVEQIANQISIAAGMSDKSTTSLNPQWLRAREIMGKNFFGVEEAVKHFGVNPTRPQLAALSEIPFSEAVLEESKNTHVLVAVFPLSIFEIHGKVDSKLFYDQSRYNKDFFARNRGEAAWHLVCKTPVPNSISEAWGEQQTLLVPNEETPTVRVMVYTIIGHFLATWERLFKNIYVRCSDVDSVGDRVYVGNFDSSGLGVYSYWDDSRFDDIGLASARKSD